VSQINHNFFTVLYELQQALRGDISVGVLLEYVRESGGEKDEQLGGLFHHSRPQVQALLSKGFL